MLIRVSVNLDDLIDQKLITPTKLIEYLLEDHYWLADRISDTTVKQLEDFIKFYKEE
jgi:hypothetical protein